MISMTYETDTTLLTHTSEELVAIIRSAETNEYRQQLAYEQLFRNLTPIILHESEMYRGTMEGYDVQDFLQIGAITAWEIISRGNYSEEGGKFHTYFGKAVRQRLAREFEITP